MFQGDWLQRLIRHLAPYLDPNDPVVQTILGAFAAQWDQVNQDWNAAEAVWGILTADSANLTRIADYLGIQRLPNEADQHLLERMAAVLASQPTQAGLAQSLRLLNFSGQPIPVYHPFGGSVVGWDPAASFRFHLHSGTGQFSRASTAWDPYSTTIVPANTPTFQIVGSIPNWPNTVQTGVGVWQASANAWPHSEWTGNTVLTTTLIPSPTNAAYWTVQSGTLPSPYTALAWQPYSEAWYASAPGVMTTGPSWTPPITLSGTLTTSGTAALLWAWSGAAGYAAVVSGTTLQLATATNTGIQTVLASGMLPQPVTNTPTQLFIQWGNGGSLQVQWTQGTQSGTISATNTTYPSGMVGVAFWAGSGTYQPGPVQSPFPATLQLTLPPGPAIQAQLNTVAGMPAPGSALSLWNPPGSGTIIVTGPPVSTSTSGTWSWWGKTAFSSGTPTAQLGSATLPWGTATWQPWSITVGSGTYTPQWIFSGTAGVGWWGMPQWELLPYATPYIPNPTSGTTSRAAESLSFPNLPHPQTQGMIGIGFYATAAWTLTSGTLFSYQSGTQALTVAWTGSEWVTTWSGSGGIVQSTWPYTLAPNQWHWGLWMWNGLGWQWGWDQQWLTGTTNVGWTSGTYTLTLYPNGYYTNVQVLDGWIAAEEWQGWTATQLVPRYAQTVLQGPWINNQCVYYQGQQGDGWAYSVGTTLPNFQITTTTNTFTLNQSALNQAALGGSQTTTIPLALLQQTVRSMLPAGAWIFPWQPGNWT